MLSVLQALSSLFLKNRLFEVAPLTVTHPDITRYFMSIDEAAQLILQAGSMGKEETEIFILKMGQPVKIDHMARELIRLSGKEPDIEIEIKYTGLREGEKLYEELITEGEGIVDTHHEKIMVLRGESFIPCDKFHGYLERLAEGAKTYDGQAIKITLKELISEYHPDANSRSVGNKETNEREHEKEPLTIKKIVYHDNSKQIFKNIEHDDSWHNTGQSFLVCFFCGEAIKPV